jgi:hypothetical protein
MKKVVFTFGRLNPPTVGHQKLVDKIISTAKREKADAKVFLSHTQNNKKDPLNYAEKIRFARKAFGTVIEQSNSKTIIQILQELQKKYTDIVLIVGSDRVSEFSGLLNKYNGGPFEFDSIDVRSAGARDPDAVGVAGMSASKLRALAIEGKFDTFKTGLPKKLSDSDAKDLYDTIRSVIKEDLDEQKKPLSISQRKAIGRRMKRLAPKLQRIKKMKAKKMADAKTIQKRAQKAAINLIRKKVAGKKGQNYANLTPGDKMNVDRLVAKKSAIIQKLAKKLIPATRKKEIARLKSQRDSKNENFDAIFETVILERQDSDIKDREGSQPAKYHSGLAKSTKTKRDSQFQKGAEKDSGDPSAYPDKHVGDSDAKTRTSKHTKKYRQMFGEKEVDQVKARIEREKTSDKKKHDRMMDRARTSDTKDKNQQTEALKNPYKGKGDRDLKRKLASFESQLADLIKKSRGRQRRDIEGEIRDMETKVQQVSAALKEEFSFDLTENAKVALQKKADKSGMPYGILKKVYDRGMAAWRTGHRPGANQQQWAFARVNSFVTKGKGTWGKADADLAAKVRGSKAESVNEEMDPRDHVKEKDGKFCVYNKDGEVVKEFDKEEDANKYAIANHDSLMESKMSDDIDKVKAKTIQKKRYNAAAKILKDIIKRKKAEAKKKGIPVRHGNEYYAGVVAKQYDVNPRVLRTMAEQMIVEDDRAGGFGSDKLRKKYQKDTPCECTEMYEDLIVEESEYQGRKVNLNNPFRLPSGSKKKFGVYVKNDKGNVVKVTFGDPNMEIKRDDPARRKSFRARHDCANKTDKTKAGYWSCYQWRASAKVDN